MLHSRALLKSLAESGEIPVAAAMLMSEHFTDHLPAYEPLPGEVPPTGAGEALCSGEFLEKAERLIADVLPAHSYSRTVEKTSAKALRMLFVFLALNGLDYSYCLALMWVEANKAEIGTGWKAYRRAVFLFEQYHAGGDIDPDRILPAKDLVDNLPAWAQTHVRAFIALKRREGYARSTVDTCRSACCRFVAYIKRRGVFGLDGITPAIILSFCLEDPHSSNEANALYASKVRSFLEYLADEGLVGPGLQLAVARESAPSTRCVAVLDDTQVSRLKEARLAARSPMGLRDAAITSLGLWMGLRASDIVGLKLADICWSGSSIAIVQRKTNAQLELPLVAEAGNSVCAYLRDGRPSSASPFVFVKHRSPYTGLASTACAKALQNTLGDLYEGCTGFHELRRTFATQMLRGGVGRGPIAEALGHATERTVHKYLSLDAERMRLCALPLALCANGGLGGGGDV
jgi:site-specific recombinase XerD